MSKRRDGRSSVQSRRSIPAGPTPRGWLVAIDRKGNLFWADARVITHLDTVGALRRAADSAPALRPELAASAWRAGYAGGPSRRLRLLPPTLLGMAAMSLWLPAHPARLILLLSPADGALRIDDLWWPILRRAGVAADEPASAATTQPALTAAA
jgi:hypothetical protein